MCGGSRLSGRQAYSGSPSMLLRTCEELPTETIFFNTDGVCDALWYCLDSLLVYYEAAK